MKTFDIGELNIKELHNLLIAYDKYIQDANDEDKYQTGWKPVCIDEFLTNDFQETT